MARRPHGLVHPFKTVLIDFLNDLKSLESSGLQSHQCKAVQDSLRTVITHLANAPKDSLWLNELKAQFDKFLGEYVLWNSSSTWEPAKRAHHERELRKIRKLMMTEFPYGPLFARREELDIFSRAYEQLIALEGIRGEGAQPEGQIFKKTAQRAAEKSRELYDDENRA